MARAELPLGGTRRAINPPYQGKPRGWAGAGERALGTEMTPCRREMEDIGRIALYRQRACAGRDRQAANRPVRLGLIRRILPAERKPRQLIRRGPGRVPPKTAPHQERDTKPAPGDRARPAACEVWWRRLPIARLLRALFLASG